MEAEGFVLGVILLFGNEGRPQSADLHIHARHGEGFVVALG